ncbi:MAG: DUF2110 family protein [Candidatus Thorarchaeota archaeon]|nr:DUF2110 family protein [Candidatus Thorarchaeota archaeon]
MQKIILKVRAYGPYTNRLLRGIEQSIQNKFTELDVSLSKIRTNKRGYIMISLTGDDEVFAANLLRKEYGTPLSLDDVTSSLVTTGWLVDVGTVGYGLYVDIGITGNTDHAVVDVLVPLHRLREQLDMPRKSLRLIAKTFALVDNLPVEIAISNVDRYNSTVEGSLSETFLDRLTFWINDEHERLFVFGANYSMIESTLRKTHHLEDIYEVESLGLHEHILVCKRSTRASGIIAAIGPRLRGVPMHLFIPREIKAMRDAST